MKVYLVMQSERLFFGRPVGASRVRGVFLTREKAEKHIGPILPEIITCKTCNHEHKNPAVDLDHNFKPWRRTLSIVEREVE